MSRLQELIKEYCPNGVEYKTLNDITKSINIGINPRKFFKLNPDNAKGFYVTVRELNGLKGVKQYDKTDLISLEAVNIINQRANIEIDDILFSNTGTVGKLALVIEEALNWGVNEGIYIIKPKKNIIISKFLYYFLDSELAYRDYSKKFTGSTLKHITQKALADIKIPVPPIEVQREIVRILDNFTELTAELKMKLTMELTARQKQYEYFRDLLLSFDVRRGGTFEVKYKTLEEIASIKARIGWQGLTKREYLVTGNYYLVTGIDFKNDAIDWEHCHYVTKERYEQDTNIQIKNDDILVTKDGTLGKIAYVTLLDKPATLNSGVFVIRRKTSRVSNRFLYHYLKSPFLMEFARSKLTGGTIKHLNQSVITQLPIPLPPIEIQNRIVNVLDNFDAICSDLKIGLPAEIEARQKQYEYYRDKLLSFDKI